MIATNLSINEKHHLTLGGVDTVELAGKYKTPLYVMDEDRIRRNMNCYKTACADAFAGGAEILFASKAFCCKQIYRIAAGEGISTDIVSPGELYTALAAGFPAQRMYFHGNNKTDEDLAYALESGVGTVIVDNAEELQALSRLCTERGSTQHIMLRVTPGIDPHTHQAINTGRIDSKFGTAIGTGQALAMTRAALATPGVTLTGFHCHIGSQIFDAKPFIDTVGLMLTFIAQVRDICGYTAQRLSLGGGFAVRYVEDDPAVDLAANIRAVGNSLHAGCAARGLPTPEILLEPGRSIVADAGLTLYSVGSVKTIPGYKTYVSVDGGMTDNPRYALYGSRYTVLCANRADAAEEMTATVAGRCCESGDLIAENIKLPSLQRGDYLAVLTTGAYNHAMASNYNRIPRPAVVMLRGGKDSLVVRRETYADVAGLDV